MRLLAPATLLTSLATLSLASPIALDEIEARWNQGESEASIHAGENYKAMTPAWDVAREPSESFDYATDERTMQMRNQRRSHSTSESLVSRMRALRDRLYYGREHKRLLEERDEPMVLRPRKGLVFPVQ